MSETAEQSWSVYLIRNNRNALYCGVTNDVTDASNSIRAGKVQKH